MPGRAYEFVGTERFQVRRRLGAGGMGVVYEAYDRERQTRVAIKTLRHLDANALYRLKNEFRGLQHLEHPNLVRLGELIESSGEWFFTMELVPGVDLMTYVRGASGDAISVVDAADHNVTAALGRAPTRPERAIGEVRYDERRLRDAFGQLALALASLHCAGKVHRDVKPSNVVVTPAGRVVLLDFGLVTAKAGTDTSDAHAVGTASYMAPEQAASKPAGEAADWYSLGIVLYEALTGRLPFTGSPLEILTDKALHLPPPPRAHQPDVPPDLDALCVELLSQDPADRPTQNEILRRLAVDHPTVVDLVTPSSPLTQSPPFIGRDEELALLRRAFDDSRRDHAVTVVVHGESGLGKSALVQEFARSIAAGPNADTVILTGHCHERESVPYKAFDGVIDELSRYMRKLPKDEAAALLPVNTALLARVFPVLGRVEVVTRAPRPRHQVTDPHELRARMFTALRELFVRLTERHPVVLILEDIQWADRDSLVLLKELMSAPSTMPLLLLICSRPGSPLCPPAEQGGRPAVVIPGDVRPLALRGLAPEAARELAAALLERVGAKGFVEVGELASEAQGHPLYTDALVRHVALSGHCDRPPRLEEAIVARADALSRSARRILELVCVAGAPLPVAIIAQAAEIHAAAFGRHLSRLRAASLVRAGGSHATETLEPFHDYVRGAVLADLSPGDRQLHNERLAIVLEAAGGFDGPLLRHLEASGQTERAALLAADAAARAGKALAFDRAAEMYRAALSLGGWAPARARELRLELATALANAGRGPDAAAEFVAAASGAEPATRLECYRQAAEQWLITGHIQRGLQTLEILLAEIGTRLAPTPRRAVASLLWNRGKLRVRGLGWRRKFESQIDREQLTRADVFKAVSHGLAMVDTVRAADFQSRGLLEALRTGERIRIARAIAAEAILCASQGGRGLARGRALVEQSREIAEADGSAYLAAWVASAKGSVGYFAGEFRSSADTLELAETMLREKTTGTTWERTSVRLLRMFSLRHMGELARWQELFDESVRDAARRGDRYLETTVKRPGSLLLLARDDVDGARQNLRDAAWMPPEGVYHLQHWYELEARAEIALYEGSAPAALDELRSHFGMLKRSMLLRVQIVRVLARAVQGRLLLAAAAADPQLIASHCKQVSSLARQMDRERIGYARVLAATLRAGVAALTRPDAVLQRLEAAIAVGDRNEMSLHGAVARWWLGQGVGGDEGRALVDGARALMARQGVANPERMARVYLPGFATP